MKKLSSLSILIQAYNNQNTIRAVLNDAIELGQKYAKDFEIIVTDDGSCDATASQIENLKFKIENLKVITHKKNQGFGKTIKEQYLLAGKDFFFSLPGDRQIRAGILAKLMEKIDKCEMVIGWRVKRQDPPFRKLQSFLYHLVLKLFFNISLHDVNCSKLFRRKILKDIKLKSKSAFVDAELCIKIKNKGYKICEVPIKHFKDLYRRSGGGSVKTILTAIKDMIYFLRQTSRTPIVSIFW